MGLGVAGLAVLGLTTFLYFSSIFYEWRLDFNRRYDHCLETLAGFSLGAESIALFARVGGGIYTKPMLEWCQAGIPEDDPRNPATIADNVVIMYDVAEWEPIYLVLM
jgi:K(+)-stimulated pyrophosphate-energized sodium pump